MHDASCILAHLSNALAWLAAHCCSCSPPALARHPHTAASGQCAGHFDYYLLSLSWSPSYCLVHPADRYQCQGRGFGFVLHGLWPQFNAGGYPQAVRAMWIWIARAEAVGRTLYPSPNLMRA